MSILWIYDKKIDPNAGGTERATHSVMSALEKNGHATAGFLVFQQDHPRAIHDRRGKRIDDLYSFLRDNDVHVIINQIGYSKWLLDEFLVRGGQRWRDEGGRVITCLHFDPSMFSETVWDLTRHWRRKTLLQKVRRLGRIALLPISRHKAARALRQAYAHLIEKSDCYIILSEKHRQKLYKISRTPHVGRVHSIQNLITFSGLFPKDRLREKRKTILIVSRLDEPQKRISLALLAWARVMRTGKFDDWTLQVVGDGEHAEDYRELTMRKRIRNVEFIGRADPNNYYDNASIYLHTAKREGWGLTITEAMQKGAVPIVMNSCAVFEDIIENGQNGILSKDKNVKEFAAHIADLISNDEKRERIAIRAIEATLRHDQHFIVEKWSALLTIERGNPTTIAWQST